jgi:hypothetical protein
MERKFLADGDDVVMTGYAQVCITVSAFISSTLPEADTKHSIPPPKPPTPHHHPILTTG